MPTHDQLFESIDKRVAQLAYRWKLYGELFDSGQDNIDLLNASSASIFGLLQELMLDDVILTLCQLTDPAASGGGKDKENASIKQLVKVSRSMTDPTIAAEIDASVERLDKLVEKLKIHRSKVIVHTDLQHSLNAKTLPLIAYDELEGAMEECYNLMGKLGTKSMYRVGGYNNPNIKFGEGGLNLLNVLRSAHAQNERIAG